MELRRMIDGQVYLLVEPRRTLKQIARAALPEILACTFITLLIALLVFAGMLPQILR